MFKVSPRYTKRTYKTGKMAQQVEDHSLIPGTHIMKGKKNFQGLSSELYTCIHGVYQLTSQTNLFFFFKNLWDGSAGKDACCQSPEPMGEGEMWLLQVVLTPPHACFSTCLPTNTHTHGQININNFLMQRKNPVGAGLRHKEKRAGWSSGEC